MLFQRHGMATPRTLLATNNEPAMAYRLVVVGDQIVTAEAQASGDEGWRAVNPSLGAVAMTLKAAHLMRVEFGSVDLLEDHDGKLVLVAKDYHCDFAVQQARGGVDVAGAMVDYLVNKCVQSPAKDKNPSAKLTLHARSRKASAHETVAGLTLQWSPGRRKQGR